MSSHKYSTVGETKLEIPKLELNPKYQLLGTHKNSFVVCNNTLLKNKHTGV